MNADRFTAIVNSVSDWATPSPCTEWTASGVLDHVVDTQRLFFAQHGAPLGERESGGPTATWATHRIEIEPLVQDVTWMGTQYAGWFGPTTVGETLSTFYGFDLLVHGWDIATTSGERYEWTETEMDQVESAISAFGPALYTEGICGTALDVPDDAGRQRKLLAALGRSA